MLCLAQVNSLGFSHRVLCQVLTQKYTADLRSTLSLSLPEEWDERHSSHFLVVKYRGTKHKTALWGGKEPAPFQILILTFPSPPQSESRATSSTLTSEGSRGQTAWKGYCTLVVLLFCDLFMHLTRKLVFMELWDVSRQCTAMPSAFLTNV